MDDKELWARARAELPDMEPPEPEDAMLLMAGYLDGRLEPAEVERVEAWLARDPAALDVMLSSRIDLSDQEADSVAVPESLLSRAQGAVRPAPASDHEIGVGSWIGGLFGRFGGVLQPVGVAAALLLAVLAGAEMAQSSFANLMTAQAAQIEGDIVLGGGDLF